MKFFSGKFSKLVKLNIHQLKERFCIYSCYVIERQDAARVRLDLSAVQKSQKLYRQLPARRNIIALQNNPSVHQHL